MNWYTTRTGTPHAVISLVSLAMIGCGTPPPDAAIDDPEPGGGGVVTLWTDALELFMEYPPQIAGQPGDVWAIHLNFLDTWQPVREGSLTLRLVDSSGQEWTFEEPQPARAGIFTPVPVVPVAGEYTVAMELVHRGQTYPVEVGAIQVYPSEAELPGPEEKGSGGIPFLKEQQWEIDFAVAMAEVRDVQRTARISGELIVPPNRVARVAAPVSGLARGGGAGSWPAIGARVGAGQTLAILAPTDTDGSFAALRGRVERLEREVARAERLYAAEAIPERRLVESRHDLEIVRAAFDAIGGDDEGAYSYRLRSPIAGVLTERRLSPGQRAEAGDLLFTVVDPRTLWLELHLPASLAGGASEVTGATFTVEGGTMVHEATRIISVGDVIDPTSRTLPVILAIESPDRMLKVGMLAQAYLWLGDSTSGTAVPADAVQDEDGLAVVYVETGGETFERRVIKIGPTDGVWTTVESGVLPGERVVTRGAYQVRLASLGDTEELGAGHQH
jgi:RND family efflux transporter MFP subunit